LRRPVKKQWPFLLLNTPPPPHNPSVDRRTKNGDGNLKGETKAYDHPSKRAWRDRTGRDLGVVLKHTRGLWGGGGGGTQREKKEKKGALMPTCHRGGGSVGGGCIKLPFSPPQQANRSDCQEREVKKQRGGEEEAQRGGGKAGTGKG